MLPKYKGLNTHERVLNAGAKKSGCTIHFVDESLDGGPIIVQASTILNKKMNLGTWQGIYLCEHRNNGGKRKIIETIYGEN